MNEYTAIVNARNRALAADPSIESRALVHMFDRTLADMHWMHPVTLTKIVRIAEWYTSQQKIGEG